jgi:hypothetical protein
MRFFQRIGAKFTNSLGHLLGDAGECCAHGSRHKEHLQALRFDTDRLQDLLGSFDPRPAAFVAAFMMAIPQAASDDVDTVRALFKGFQNVLRIRLTRAGQADDLHVGWIRLAQGTSGIRGHVGAINAGEDRDFGIEARIAGHTQCPDSISTATVDTDKTQSPSILRRSIMRPSSPLPHTEIPIQLWKGVWDRGRNLQHLVFHPIPANLQVLG